jgi:protein-tyrosine phosphatase
MRHLGMLPMLPYLGWVWSVFWLKRILLREPCWHRIAPGLYLGRRPRPNELPDDCGAVVDLTAEFPVPPGLLRADCAYRCLPTLNRFVPSADAFASLIQELLALDAPIYVYCAAGRGRSAMLVAALLLLRGQVASLEAAELQLRAVRRGVYLHPVQRAFIARHCASHLDRAGQRTPASSAATPCE